MVVDLTQSAQQRSEIEIYIFQSLEGLLLIARFLAIIYFTVQTVRHSRYQGEKRDIYTYYTFLFLVSSHIMFFANRL